MIARDKIIADFIAGSEWATWDRHPLAGDASSRRYERLVKGSETVILMDAPANSTRPFAEITTYLQSIGLRPPHIHAHEAKLGLMVLSDLGENDFARWLANSPAESTSLYQAAVDVLIHLSQRTAPAGLTKMTPEVGAEMVEITGEFYAERAIPDVIAQTRLALAQHAPDPDTIALRDFHAENLIWRPQESGFNRVGLLDYQDAFIAPAGYDLASLLRDVRREIDPSLAQEMIDYYVSQTHANEEFHARVACLGAQRNLRILGVFARLSREMGKKRYVDLIPRVWSNLMTDLQHPALGDLKQAVRDTLPAPDAFTLGRLRT